METSHLWPSLFAASFSLSVVFPFQRCASVLTLSRCLKRDSWHLPSLFCPFLFGKRASCGFGVAVVYTLLSDRSWLRSRKLLTEPAVISTCNYMENLCASTGFWKKSVTTLANLHLSGLEVLWVGKVYALKCFNIWLSFLFTHTNTKIYVLYKQQNLQRCIDHLLERQIRLWC